MNIRIAVVQFEIKQFSPEENLRKAESFIKEAAYLKADMIVFPEDFVTGPLLGRIEFADSDNKYVGFFQKAARKYKIAIIPGSIIEKSKGGFYNVAYYIDSSGKIRARYKKINLWIPERRYITPGNEICVFNTKYGKIGLAICWDLAFPEIFRKMIARGARIIVCPSYWTTRDAGNVGLTYDKNAEIKMINSLCAARAFENEIALVYCNSAGSLHAKKGNKMLDLVMAGNSQVDVPFKGCIKRLEHGREEMFVAEVNTKILVDAERNYRIRKDIRSRILN